jgi:hypothetical protein
MTGKAQILDDARASDNTTVKAQAGDSLGQLKLSSLKNYLNAWGLNGNAGTTAGTNFVGTLDAQDLVFKTNNTERGRFNTANQLLLNNGNAAIPPFSFIGNSTTGIFSDGTNLNFSVGGSERLKLDANGLRVFGNGELTLNTPTFNTLINTNYNTNFNNCVIIGKNSINVGLINSLTLGVNSIGNDNFSALTGGFYSSVYGHLNYIKMKFTNGNIAFGTQNGESLLYDNISTFSYRNTMFGYNNLNSAIEAQDNLILSNYALQQSHKLYNTTKIGGYLQDQHVISGTTNVLINSGFYNTPTTNAPTITVASVNTTTNEITLTTPLPAEFVGSKNFNAYSTSGTFPTPMVINTQYVFEVISTTVIKPIGITLTGIQIGGIFKRYRDELKGVVSIMGGYDGNYQANIGDINTQSFGLSDRTTVFDLSKKSYSILDNNTVFIWKSTDNKFVPTKLSDVLENFFNTDLTQTAERTHNNAGFNTYINGTGAFLHGTPTGFGNFATKNSTTGRTALRVEGLSGRTFNVDFNGAGVTRSDIENFTFFDQTGTQIANVNNIGLTTSSGKRIGIGTAAPSSELHIVGTTPKAIIESPTSSSTLSLKSNVGKTYDISSGANTVFELNNSTDAKSILKYDPTATTGYTQLSNDNSFIKVQNDKKLVFSTTTSTVPINFNTSFDPLPSFYFYDNNPVLRLLNSDATITTGKGLGTIYAGGQVAGVEKISGQIGFYSSENWTAGAQGTSFELSTTANGGNSASPRILIHNNGAVRLISNSQTTSDVNIGGSVSYLVQKSNISATLANHRTMIVVAGALAITAPAANTCTGREYRIINNTATNGTISSYIDLSGTAVTILKKNETLNILSDGTNWYQF